MNPWFPEKPLRVEVVATSIESCLVAERSGASRIELCSALSTAGLTPSSGLLQTTKALVRIPVFVLIRPREGHFVYTTAEKTVMLRDIENALLMGADGIVTGALLPDNSLDTEFIQQAVKYSGGVPVTFHRAFDALSDPYAAIDELIGLGVQRILSSGGARHCLEGKSQLQEWVAYSQGKIAWIAGKGLSPQNAASVYFPEMREYHLSGHAPVHHSIAPNSLFDYAYSETLQETITNTIATLRQLDLENSK
jgi:copper homeostasis protein